MSVSVVVPRGCKEESMSHPIRSHSSFFTKSQQTHSFLELRHVSGCPSRQVLPSICDSCSDITLSTKLYKLLKTERELEIVLKRALVDLSAWITQ